MRISAMYLWAAAGVCSTPASAATVTFRQGQSPGPAYVSGGAHITGGTQAGLNSNFSTSILVGNSPTGSGVDVYRGLLEFDLSEIEEIAGGSPYVIDAVQLNVFTDLPGGNVNQPVTFNLSVLGTNTDFDEATVNWNNAPSVPGGSFGVFLGSATFNPSASIGEQSFTSSQSFQAAVTDALAFDADNTLRLIINAATGEGLPDVQNYARFVSNEGVTATRPEIVVEFSVVPEPSAALLGLGAAAGLLMRRRRTV